MVLRNVIEDDLPILFEHQRDPEACAMAGFTSRDWDAFQSHWRHVVLANPNSVARTVLLEGRVAGYVSSWESESECLVGYWFGREYWGTGLARSALEEYLRSHELRRPVYADVIVSNIRSIRLLEKCGFRQFDEPNLSSGGVVEVRFQLKTITTAGNRE